MVKVELTKQEMLLSAYTGCHRRIESIFLGIGRKLGKNSDRAINEWETDIEAACAETAVAKAKDIYHGYGVNTFKNPDVGEYQVKHSPDLTKNLYLNLTQYRGDIFYLCLGMAPTMYVIGHQTGEVAMQPKYWRASEEAFIVPQRDLIPFGPPILLKSWEIEGPDQWKEGDGCVW